MRLVGDGVDVIGQAQRGDVGVQPIDDRPALRARSAMAHAEGDGLAGLLLPIRRKGRVECLIQFAGGIVRYVGDLNRRRPGQHGCGQANRGRQSGDGGGKEQATLHEKGLPRMVTIGQND